MITLLDREQLLQAFRILLDDETNFNEKFLLDVRDRIQKQARMSLSTQQKHVPAFLMNYCIKCGGYQNVTATDTGQLCQRCRYPEILKEQPKKFPGWIVVYDATNIPRRVLGKVNAVSVPELAAAYTLICKKAGFTMFSRDPADTFVGGYYSNEKNERVLLSPKEVIVARSKDQTQRAVR